MVIFYLSSSQEVEFDSFPLPHFLHKFVIHTITQVVLPSCEISGTDARSHGKLSDLIYVADLVLKEVCCCKAELA